MTRRTVTFWIWFAIGMAALAWLWSTIEAGRPFGPADGVALIVLLAAGFILGRLRCRSDRTGDALPDHRARDSLRRAHGIRLFTWTHAA